MLKNGKNLQLTFTSAIDELGTIPKPGRQCPGFDIMNRIDLIETLARADWNHLKMNDTESLRNKLKVHLLEFIPQESMDKNRFEQELIYYLEKT